MKKSILMNATHLQMCMSKVKKIFLIIAIFMSTFAMVRADIGDNVYTLHNVYIKDNNTLKIQQKICNDTKGTKEDYYDSISVAQAIELYDLLYCIYNDKKTFENTYETVISSYDSAQFYVTKTINYIISYFPEDDSDDFILITIKNTDSWPLHIDHHSDFQRFLFLLKLNINILKVKNINIFKILNAS